MIALPFATAELLRLTCQLQAVSLDGSNYVGPVVIASFEGPTYQSLARKSDADRQPNSSLLNADPLGLPAQWTAIENWHGSIVLEPDNSRPELTGMLIPNTASGFDVFFANKNRRNVDGAPITEFGGTCVYSEAADLAGDVQ